MTIALVGMPGCGKSTVGRHLARHLGLRLVDSDHEIERRIGMPIRDWFEAHGEAAFRDIEQQTIERLCQCDGIVLATGGGAVLAESNRRVLHDRGFVLYLSTTVAQQLSRLARDVKRPLLQAPDRRERLDAMAAQRNPLYEEIADLTVTGSNTAVAQAARQIAARLEGQWQRKAVAA